MIRHPDLLNVRCPHCDSKNVDIRRSLLDVDEYGCNACGQLYTVNKRTGYVKREPRG
jgi:DNA-directed RNA polymerase subunit RPC12/RpoP